MTALITRFTFFSIAILLGTISMSVGALAQSPASTADEVAGRVAKPEFRLTELLAQSARNRHRLTGAVRNSMPNAGGSTNASPTLFNISMAATSIGPNLPVTGGGTLGRITKWIGFTSSNSFIGDTTIFEDKSGNVGIGTDSPTSRLSVAGMIQSLTGGIKFPDGTLQTTAASGNALTTVNHDSTLTGSGTGGSPLGVAVPLNLTGSSNNAIIFARNLGGGVAVEGDGGVLGAGFIGVAGQGDAVSGFNIGGTGVVASGGEAPQGIGGMGSLTRGGDGLAGGDGVEADGGNSTLGQGQGSGTGGAGLRANGGTGSGSGATGGDGIVAVAGAGVNGATKGAAAQLKGQVFVTDSCNQCNDGSVSIQRNLNVTGTKNFRIDHPLDPKNKYLYHAALESSEVLNFYTGNVRLDAKGEAIVELPDWFEAINRDFRYSLTSVGAPGLGLYVAEEVSHNQFKIAGGQPFAKVSWQLTAIRSDAAMRSHPFKPEEDKPEPERGTYVSPEAYRQPDDKRVKWLHRWELMQTLKHDESSSNRSCGSKKKKRDETQTRFPELLTPRTDSNK